ncbi:MAG: flagellar motor stator protein MotA [Rhodospirillales bacterium]
MFFLIGLVIAAGSVVGGYLGGGGHLDVLWQPFEFVIIFGCAIGAFVVSNPKPILTGTVKSFGKLLKGPSHSKACNLELLGMLYSMFKLAKTKGDLALESHVEQPYESPIFQNFPTFTRDRHAVEFVCDYLRLLTLGAGNPHEFETVIETDLEVHHTEKHAIAGALQGVADGLPALGIVAAVLGVIHTMGSITEPPEVLGRLIGAALVGTFSGVLAAYGLVAPMAKSLENTFNAEARYLECVKTGIISHMQGYAPQVSVEFARKTLNSHVRPTFGEVDEMIQNIQV